MASLFCLGLCGNETNLLFVRSLSDTMSRRLSSNNHKNQQQNKARAKHKKHEYGRKAKQRSSHSTIRKRRRVKSKSQRNTKQYTTTKMSTTTSTATTMWTSKLGNKYPLDQMERDHHASMQQLTRLRHSPGNHCCAECGTAESGNVWSSVNLGVFTCIRCGSRKFHSTHSRH